VCGKPQKEFKGSTVHSIIETSDSAFPAFWKELLENDPLQNPLYLQQREGASSPVGLVKTEPEFEDRSFLIVARDAPVFGCSLTTHKDDSGGTYMGHFGMEASTHVNRTAIANPSNNFEPQSICLLQEHITRLMEEVKPHSVDYLDPVSCGIMSPVTQVLLERGATPTVQKAQLIDLSLSEYALARNISKSYRGLIHWGRRNLQFEILSASNIEETRGESTDGFLQSALHLASQRFKNYLGYEGLLRKGSAFLVRANYQGEATTNALFVHNHKTCHYLTSSTTAVVPHRPILHSMIWHAMLHGKRLGCNRFDLASSTPPGFDGGEFCIEADRFGGLSHTRLKLRLIQ
jgi:hypothetical protein|tara:strand:- start:511 stop:1551 length:1041 start_codon:yes stop_codon:yes gene_type:complete